MVCSELIHRWSNKLGYCGSRRHFKHTMSKRNILKQISLNFKHISLYNNKSFHQFSPLIVVPHRCVSEVGQHLLAEGAPGYFLNQCWLIAKWALSNKLQWKSNQNTSFSLKKSCRLQRCRPFSFGLNVLTHWGLVTPFGDIDLGQHWIR